MNEVVTLVVGGTVYTAWKSMSVKYSAESAERTFNLEAADETPDLIGRPFVFAPGTPCQLFSNGTLLIAGFVKDLAIPFGPTEHNLSVSGTTKGRDAHDNSTKHTKNEWENKTPLQVAQEVDPSINWATDEQLKPLKVFRANMGEKAFDIVTRAARSQNIYLHGLADGTVMLTRHGKQRHAGAIVEGINFHKGTANFSDEGRYNKTTVKGQQPDGTTAEDIQVSETAQDSSVREGRETIVYATKPVTRQEAKTLANQIRDRARGASVTASLTVVGFRDQLGEVWQTGNLVYVQSATLGLARDMAIKEVALSQDNGGQGSLAQLELVDPSNLGGKGNSGGRQATGRDNSAPTWKEAGEDWL